MVQPQDDLLVKTMKSLSDIHAEMISAVKSPQMQERAAENASKVENFSLELGEQVKDVQLRVSHIRSQIADNIGSHDNICGFLTGETDDYISEFDEQVVKFFAKLAQDKAHWTSQAKKFDGMKGKQMDEIKNAIQEAQRKISQIIFQQAEQERCFELKNFPTSDLACFGENNHEENVAFRWPTQDDL